MVTQEARRSTPAHGADMLFAMPTRDQAPRSPEPSAADRWRELLTARAIPPGIRAAAPDNPYRHDPKRFVAPERPSDTPSRRVALELLGDGGTVLDIGCGGGAASLAVAERATSVVGVDPAEEMLDGFARVCQRRGMVFRTVQGAWPDVADAAGPADVVLCHHVGYNTAELAPFVAALAVTARRGVVMELHAEHPTAWLDPLWTRFHGLRRGRPATAEDALAVLHEVGVRPAVHRWSRPPRHANPAEEAEFARRQLCLRPSRTDEVAAAIATLPPRARAIVTFSWKS